MSKEAVCLVLDRASSEPDFLRLLAYGPARALDGYPGLTLEEKAALVSGKVAEIEAKAGKKLKKWLRARIEEQEWPSRIGRIYLAREAKKELTKGPAVLVTG